jgi:hypothetical protein
MAIITLTNPHQDIDQAGQAGDEIRVTPAMIEAGVYAAKEHCIGEGLEALVFRVFATMRTEELNSKVPRLIDKK